MVFVATFLEARDTPSTAPPPPQAFTVPPSQVWDGNDGAWSSFVIRVGNPAQNFRVLPATSSDETWVPAPNDCEKGVAWCGNGRGVEPFNAGTSGPASGSPNGVTLASLDAGDTCTANKSPMCRTEGCNSINGKCTGGPCPGRYCCGDTPGVCNTGGCNGVSGICTGEYIGCPCPGADYNAAPGAPASPSAANPLNARGFIANASTSWSDQGRHWIDTEVPIYQPDQAEYGVDAVGIGPDASTGLTLDKSIVAGVAAQQVYVGQIGLQPSNSSGPNRALQSFMTQLGSQKKIPSSSFGYSAGSLYQQQPVLGSLTLGGYDASRLIPNDVTFAITDSNQLHVPLQAITASSLTSPSAALLSENITALIDTSSPQSRLPLSACQAFETAFGLTWDSSTSLYLVNDTMHQKLLNTNPSVIFSFGVPSPTNPPINITLPYAAFDLQAAAPIFANGTNYFPIRRAGNDSIYTIGRAIFQEIYLIVDYEAGNFSLSQAKYPAPTSPSIVTINHHPVPATGSSTSQTAGLSAGAIAGAVIGGCLAALVLAGFIFFFFRLRRRSNLARQEIQREKDPSQSSFFTSSDRPKVLEGLSQSPMRSPMRNGSTFSDSMNGRSSSNMTSPIDLKSPMTELDNNTWSSTKSVMCKPLPRLPVELPADEVAGELMEKSRSMGHTPKGRRSRTIQPRSGDMKYDPYMKF